MLTSGPSLHLARQINEQSGLSQVLNYNSWEVQLKEPLSDSIRCAVLLSESAPPAIRTHLRLNASRLTGYQNLKEVFLQFVQADQQVPMDVGYSGDRKGKGKKGQGKDKYGKCAAQQWQQRCQPQQPPQQPGKLGGKKGGKGKPKQGRGQQPPQQQQPQKPFTGFSGKCGRRGHKARDCRNPVAGMEETSRCLDLR
eukprot:3501017-Amphidinium_carterae.1